jgi:hypothetical protein
MLGAFDIEKDSFLSAHWSIQSSEFYNYRKGSCDSNVSSQLTNKVGTKEASAAVAMKSHNQYSR